MKIYFDMCALQRPLDYKDQVRIKLEAEAVLCILELIDGGTCEMISSDALVFETDRNPSKARREHASLLLSKASTFVALDDDIKKRSAILSGFGFKPSDAFHLASAEKAKAEYFCTCDDRLFHRAKRVAGLLVKVVTPIELSAEINL